MHAEDGMPCSVSIIGPSDSGKSQLAKQVVNLLGDDVAARIPVDYFLLPRPLDMFLEAYFARPLDYDWDLLRAHMQAPMGTVLTTPDVDWTQFTRRADVGGRSYVRRPLMICDAMVPFPDANLVVGLTLPANVQLERLRVRDLRWGSHVAERPGHVHSTWASVDTAVVELWMDGTTPLAENAQVLARAIREWQRGESKR